MRGIAAVALALAWLGCAVGHADPTQTVVRYLDALANDPIRTLTLVTDRFHEAHGLRFEEVGDLAFATEPAAPQRFDDAALELERARFGWLTVLTKPFFAIQEKRYTRSVASQSIDGDRARVVVRVEGESGRVLEVPFRLVREDPEAAWRIDAVLLPEIDDDDLGAAFLVAPNAALHRRIEARRRRARP